MINFRGKIKSDQKDGKIRKNLVTYIICFIIATMLWFFNALSKDYYSYIEYPVEFVNAPNGKLPSSALPEFLSLNVKASGFAIMAGHIRPRNTINVDLSLTGKTESEKNNQIKCFINLMDIKEKIASQISSEYQLQEISPSTISLIYSESKSKKVVIKPICECSFRKQYSFAGEPMVVPDSVTISGPSSIIDTITSIYTNKITVNDAWKTFTNTVNLIYVPNITTNVSEATVTVNIEQYTETENTFKIICEGLPDSLNVKFFPSTITAKYEVGLSNFEKVKTSDITFYVDYSECKSNSEVDVKISNQPTYIKNLKILPQKVEFILERKK